MELHGANVVKVAKESEEASVRLVVPYLDFVVIPCHVKQNRYASVESRILVRS
jgi:hypothetical protein